MSSGHCTYCSLCLKQAASFIRGAAGHRGRHGEKKKEAGHTFTFPVKQRGHGSKDIVTVVNTQYTITDAALTAL